MRLAARRAAALTIALPLLTAGGLAAQSVTGVARADTDGEPIAGAFVSLIDGAGAEVDGVLSGEGGEFRLRAAEPGSYSIRVARIGIETWTSPPITLEAGEVRSLEAIVPIRAVRLSDLHVTVDDQCVSSPEDVHEVWLAWGEARKALETTALAAREALYRFEIELYERYLDPETGRPGAEARRPGATFSRAPFRSLSARRLAEDGYARAVGDSVQYYMPNPTALLSTEFEDTHCFGIRRAARPDGRELVGVTFVPVGNRSVPEIRGVLWLDAETAALERLEYDYVNAPLGLRHDRMGGVANFVRLPTGAFVVAEWWITMPEVDRLVDFAGRLIRERIARLKQDGGTVVSVTDRHGNPIELPEDPWGRSEGLERRARQSA